MYGYFYDKDLKQVFIDANNSNTSRELINGTLHLIWEVPLTFKSIDKKIISIFDLNISSGMIEATFGNRKYLMNAKDIQKKSFNIKALEDISNNYKVTPVSARAIIRYIVNTMSEQYIDESPESLFSYNTRTVSDGWEPSRSPYEDLPMDWWETL